LKIVVTGSSGKLAKYLIPKLTNKHEVLLYDKQPPKQSHAHFILGEVTNRDKLIKTFNGADAVIHLAALRSRFNNLPMNVMETNVVGTFSVLEAAHNQGVKKLIFSSSDAVLGIAQSQNDIEPEYLPTDEKHPLKPQDPYGISKTLGEEMCRFYAMGYDMNIIALRFSNIFCPGDEQKYLNDARDPSVRRKSLWAWVHVEDAVQAIMSSLASNLQGFEVFHIAADDVCLSNPDVPYLLSTYFPEIPIKRSLSNQEGLIDCRKAKDRIGLKVRKRFDKIMALKK
jgi:UDP-glucose 4-epimerase